MINADMFLLWTLAIMLGTVSLCIAALFILGTLLAAKEMIKRLTGK